MKLHSARSGVVALLLAVIGCAPSIARFDAVPVVLCDGAALVRWEAAGDIEMQLQTEPTAPAVEACTATGRETYALTLVAARNGDEARRQIEVVQLHPGATEPVAFATSEISGNDLIAKGEKNLALWRRDETGDLAKQVVITNLVACDHRAIEAVHDGKTASLAADGTPSRTLAGVPIGGYWTLRSPMTAAESADPHSRPKNLKILASVECRKVSP